MAIVLNTLNTLIDDIMLEERSNNISESEALSKIQVEQWIIHYRTMLIKQDIDKGRQLNPDYIQSINNLTITDKDENKKPLSLGVNWVGRTVVLPNGIDFHFADNIVSITDDFDNTIQLSSEDRAKRQVNRRYSMNDTVAYEKDGRLYFVSQTGVDKVNIRGIFEDPMDPLLGMTADERYPIPANMIPTLKELIMTKEINVVALSDVTNDSSNDLEKTSLNAMDYRKLSRGIK